MVSNATPTNAMVCGDPTMMSFESWQLSKSHSCKAQWISPCHTSTLVRVKGAKDSNGLHKAYGSTEASELLKNWLSKRAAS